MPVEQALMVPLTYDLPVNVQISIEPLERDRGYRICIIADGWDWCEFFIPLKRDDIKNLNAKLQTAIESVTYIFGESDTDLNERRKALFELAEKGHFAFNKIFTEGELRDTVYAILKRSETIQVTSNDFIIPWDLLYGAPLDDQVDAFNFWGMRYIVSRNLIRAGNRDAFTSSTIQSPPRVGLIAYNKLKHVIDKEIPALKRLEEQQQIVLLPLRELDPNQRREALKAFGQFLYEKLQVLHSACDADQEKIQSNPNSILSETILSDPFLIVSNEFRIKMDDFVIKNFNVGSKPLVILNACVTGTINPLCTSNWAVLFWERGASAILATEFHVPDWFAAVFIEKLYEQLLLGKPIGEALLAARRHFSKSQEQENPLGLAYALYSRRNVRIVNSN